MRCGRNILLTIAIEVEKMDEYLEIYHLIDVLRCGNRIISGIIDSEQLNYYKNNAHTRCNSASRRDHITTSGVHYFYNN